MDQFSGPRPRFPRGVYAPAPRFIGNSFVSPPPYQLPHYPRDYQNYPQPQPHYFQGTMFPRNEEYVPNVPQELWSHHLHRHPFAPPPPSNLHYPFAIQRGPGLAPQFVVGHRGYFPQPPRGYPQPYYHSSNYWEPAPPPPTFASLYRPPPPYPQADYRGVTPVHPIIPASNPPHTPQPNQNQDVLPDNKKGESWYQNEDETFTAFQRMRRNNRLMNSVLDEHAVNSEPNLGALTRVESLKRQVGLLENEVKKEREGCDEAKKKCEDQMNSFKESSGEYNRIMEHLNNQNYEEMSDEMINKLYQDLKEKVKQSQHENVALAGCCEGLGGQQMPRDQKSSWNVDGSGPLTREEGPGDEAARGLPHNRNSTREKVYTELTVCPNPASFTAPPLPFTPPYYPRHQSQMMFMSQHHSQHYEPPPPHFQQPPYPRHGFEQSSEQERQEYEQYYNNMENELRAARLKILKLVLEEKFRRDRQAVLERQAQNRATTDTKPSTVTTATGEHSSQTVASGMDPLPNSAPPEPVQQGRLSNRVMSGGGVAEVTQSTPQSPLPALTTEAAAADLDAATGEEEKAQGDDGGNGVNEPDDIEVEQPRSPSQEESQTLRLKAPTLAKLLEAPCAISYSKMDKNINSALHSALTGSGRQATEESCQDADFVSAGLGQSDDQNGSPPPEGKEGGEELKKEDESGGNADDDNMQSGGLEEIGASKSEGEDDDNNLE